MTYIYMIFSIFLLIACENTNQSSNSNINNNLPDKSYNKNLQAKKQHSKKQRAPILISSKIGSKSAIINVLFLKDTMNVSIDVYGVKGLKIQGNKTRISNTNFSKNLKYKEEIFYLSNIENSHLVVSVKGESNGHAIQRIQSFSTTPTSSKKEYKENVIIDLEGQGLHIKKAKTIIKRQKK